MGLGYQEIAQTDKSGKLKTSQLYVVRSHQRPDLSSFKVCNKTDFMGGGRRRNDKLFVTTTTSGLPPGKAVLSVNTAVGWDSGTQLLLQTSLLQDL